MITALASWARMAVALALHERNSKWPGPGSLIAGWHAPPVCLGSPAVLPRLSGVLPPPGNWKALGCVGGPPLPRLYPTTDGWILRALRRCLRLAEVTRPPSLCRGGDTLPGQYPDPHGPGHADAPLAKRTQHHFRTRAECANWLDALKTPPTALAWSRMLRSPIFRYDPSVRQAGLIVTRAHPERGNVDHLGTPRPISPARRCAWVPQRLYPGGNNAVEILQELGYAAAEDRAIHCPRRRASRLTALEKGSGWRAISQCSTATEYASFRVSMRDHQFYLGHCPTCFVAITNSLTTARSSSAIHRAQAPRLRARRHQTAGAGQIREPAGWPGQEPRSHPQPYHWRPLPQH